MFRYSIKGKVTQAFILRGLYYATGKPIDTNITEKELELIKTHCEISKIVDLQNSTPKAIPTNSKSKGVTNELQKPTGRENSVRLSKKI